MIKRTFSLFLIILISQICFSQNDWNFYGSNLLTFRENADWIRKNNIETIYELDYLQSDSGRLHIINKYSFDSRGLATSIYQSPPYFYTDWVVGDSLEFKTFRKFHYEKIDSMYLQTTIFYKRLEDGTIDTITTNTKYINLDKVHHAKIGEDGELIFKYDSDGNCIRFTSISEWFGRSDTINTKLIYKRGRLTEVKEDNSIIPFGGLRSAKYYYNRRKQLIKMVVLGNPKVITYKYYYDKNNFIVKREMYFEDRPSGYNKYIYVKAKY